MKGLEPEGLLQPLRGTEAPEKTDAKAPASPDEIEEVVLFESKNKRHLDDSGTPQCCGVKVRATGPPCGVCALSLGPWEGTGWGFSGMQQPTEWGRHGPTDSGQARQPHFPGLLYPGIP